jgi:GDP-mannose transporter
MPPKEDGLLCKWDALVSILAYSSCSATLLLCNKVVLHFIPSGPLVTSMQFLFCIMVILILHAVKVVIIEPITPEITKKYGLYVIVFVAGVYANMQSLKHVNVDTVIVFRAMTPLIVAVCEFMWMGRAFPSFRSLFALISIILGSIWYVYFDADATVESYSWVTAYMFLIATEMLWGKKIVGDLQINLTTSVFVTNLFAFLPMLFLGYITGDFAAVEESWFTANSIALLAVSCIISAGIGYTGWWCRSVVTAAAFTLVGTLNKILTILLNIVIWDKHASLEGTLGLFVCLIGGSLYQQAPMLHSVKALPLPSLLKQTN